MSKKFKLNVIDICVVLIVIVALCAIYFKFNLSSHSQIASSTDTVKITLQASSVRDFTVNQFKLGDKLFLEEDDSYVGDVVNVYTESAYDYIRCADGQVKKAQVPNRYNLYVDIECPAHFDGDKVYIHGGKQIYLAQENIYYTKSVQTTAKVANVEKAN